jgi:hypothetical protein
MTVADNDFVYQQRSREDVERHYQRGRFDATMGQARGGNLEPLRDYFRAFLPGDHVDAIIEFIKRRLRRDLIKALPTAEREAEDAIAALARYWIKMLPRPDGKLENGTYRRLINEAAECLAEDGELGRSDPARIDFKRIRAKVRRGTKRR